MNPHPLQPFDPAAPVHRFRLNLPHWQQLGATYFLTFRLADSLPKPIVREWLADRTAWLTARGLKHVKDVATLPVEEQRRFTKHFVGRIERTLDTCHGECILRQPAAAQFVADALLFFQGTRYWLDCAVVMPNHVHALVTPLGEHRLDRIVHSWKSFTARTLNHLRGREGKVWQAESYDHLVRSEESLVALRKYLRNNPEKARLGPREYLLIWPEPGNG